MVLTKKLLVQILCTVLILGLAHIWDGEIFAFSKNFTTNATKSTLDEDEETDLSNLEFNDKDFSKLSHEEKEQKLIEKELKLEQQNKELQKQILRNEKLEQEKIKQLLNLAGEISKRKQKEQEISLLKRNKDLQRQVLNQKKKEIQLLEFQNKITQEKLQEEQKIRLYFNLMIVILVFLVIVSLIYFRSNKIKNKELAKQNSYLTKAQKIINAKNEKLKTYNENLENLVQQRTKVLTQTNNQLINNNSQLEQFAYILAHNIKAPIARLIGLAILFKKNIPDLTAENKFIVNKIDESVLDLNQVVKDLNIILEIKSGIDVKRENINLENLVDKIKRRLETQITESNVIIRTNLSPVDEIYSVKVYLESIIYNLISNAIKYKSEDRLPIIDIQFLEDENSWTLKVKDNGLGIDLDKFKDKIFGLYKRFHNHIEGKGMGLYLVKIQVELLGGEIIIDSKVNNWSEFTVTVPIIIE